MGFAAFPAGNRNSGSFNNLGSNANFWTANENSSSNAYNRNFKKTSGRRRMNPDGTIGDLLSEPHPYDPLELE